MHGKLGGSWHNLRGLVQHKPLAKEIENLSQKSKSIAAQCDYVISPFFLPQALQPFEIGKLRQEWVLLENN
jgi:hypothetical protein